MLFYLYLPRKKENVLFAEIMVNTMKIIIARVIVIAHVEQKQQEVVWLRTNTKNEIYVVMYSTFAVR